MRKGHRLPQRGNHVGTERAPAGMVEHVERLEGAAGSVPPVRVPLVDGPVGRDRGHVPLKPVEDQVDDLGPRRPVGHEAERGDQDVAVDPGAPVVHVAVQAEPVPVSPGDKRGQHPPVNLVPDAGPDAGDVVVELVAQEVIDPGQLGGDLAGTQVEERFGHGRHDRAAAVGVIVRGPAPAALLAQQGHAVGHLVDPQWIKRHGGHHRGPAEPALAGEHHLLILVAVAVAKVARVAVGERYGPGRTELACCHRPQFPQGGRVHPVGRPHQSVIGRGNGQGRLGRCHRAG